MSLNFVRVGDLSEQIRGVTYGKDDASKISKIGYLPVLRAGNITDHGLVYNDLVYVPTGKVSDKQKLRKGDIVVAASSGSLDVVGKTAPVLRDFDGGFGAFCKVLRPNSRVDANYFAQFFKTPRYRKTISALAAGANINNLRNEHLDDLLVPLPPLPEQRRTAAILDQADALRAKRREALAQLDSLTQSIFIEMFGDPAKNPLHWPTMTLGSVACKFSDGPFGSNLKSEHYVDDGVRVIRLQNIGVNEFVDKDKAYVSESHFESIKKHECRPGDVLVGTMGDPNLRACLLPERIGLAINKADCVQIRVAPKVANSVFLCGLLNHPSTLLLAQNLMHGQTRVRISMGGLRGLKVPVPPLFLQQTFATRIQSVEAIKANQRAALQELDTLFASLQHRAFRGEL